jgi:hypothetical protein
MDLESHPPFTNGFQKPAKKTSFCATPDGFTDSEARPLWVGGATPLLKKFAQNFLLPFGRLVCRQRTVDAFYRLAQPLVVVPSG